MQPQWTERVLRRSNLKMQEVGCSYGAQHGTATAPASHLVLRLHHVPYLVTIWLRRRERAGIRGHRHNRARSHEFSLQPSTVKVSTQEGFPA